MESDIQEEYNKKIFINALKTGKVSSRRGLGRRIYLLCGLDPYSVPPSDTSDWNGTYPMFGEAYRYIMYPYNYYYSGSKYVSVSISEMLTEASFEIYKKYLGIDKDAMMNKHVVKFNNSLCIYFKKSHLIPWAEMDNALKEMYPKNHRIDSNGFVHFKSNPIIRFNALSIQQSNPTLI